MAGGSVKFVTHRKGTWADSETETGLKTLLTFARSHGGAGRRRELLDYGQLHVKLFDALKKEFKCLRSVSMLLKDQVRQRGDVTRCVCVKCYIILASSLK